MTPTTANCDFPPGETFGFRDDPGEHDPCYVIMPGGAMLVFNHHADPDNFKDRASIALADAILALTAPTQSAGGTGR